MKKQSWRHEPYAYPFRCQLQTRYTDLDTWRHVNNVAVHKLHVEGRMRQQMAVLGADAWYADGVRLRPEQANTQFLRVTEYPADLECGVRVVEVGDTRYRVAVGLFQDGHCVGVQDCMVSGWTHQGAVDTPAPVLEAMAGVAQPVPDLPPMDTMASVPDPVSDYPLHAELSARYVDLDADSGVSEGAVARYMEQGRSSLVRQLHLGDRGVVVATVNIRHGSYRPVGGPVNLHVGVSRLGRSSFVLRTTAVRRERLVAMADSVMVLTDRGTGKPAVMSEAFRDDLRRFCLQSAETA